MTMKQKGTMPNNEGFTCRNTLCNKIFSKPLRTVNLGMKKAEPYLACPYCLTELNSEESSSLSGSNQDEEADKGKEEIVKAIEEKIPEPALKPQCAHHFGYLSERSRKEQIPEECMVCENMLNCMFKSMKG